MKATLTHSNLRRDSLLALLSLLLLQVGICQAQSSSGTGFVALPISIFVVVATLMCICFWVCFCFQMAKRRQLYGTPANVHYTPYVHNQRPYYSTGAQAQPGSYPVQGYVVPSATPAGVNPPQTQQAYPSQGYVPPSTGVSVVPSVSPLAHPGAIPQATSEPVPLPEATLHQGDAPPGYEEAIGIKTVDIVDLDNQQT